MHSRGTMHDNPSFFLAKIQIFRETAAFNALKIDNVISFKENFFFTVCEIEIKTYLS